MDAFEQFTAVLANIAIVVGACFIINTLLDTKMPCKAFPTTMERDK